MPRNAPTPEQLASQVAWLRRQLGWVERNAGSGTPLAIAVRVILRDPQGGGDGR